MINAASSNRRPAVPAFTLIELLAAMAVGTALLVLLLTLANSAGSTWNHHSALIEKRRIARALQEFLTTDLTRAALPVAGQIPDSGSNLQFIANPAGANLPADIQNPHSLFWQTTNATNTHLGEIAEVGYFVSYREVGGKPLFQLCRLFVNAAQSDPAASSDPSKYTANPDFLIYDRTSRFAWLRSTILDKYSKPDPPAYQGLFADGVIGFWVRCLDPLGNQITKTAAYTPVGGTAVTSSAYTDGAYDSTKGYEYQNTTSTPPANVDVPPPALPASVEFTAILVDSTGLARLTTTDAATIRANYGNVKKPGDLPAFIQSLPVSIRGSASPFYMTIYPKNSL